MTYDEARFDIFINTFIGTYLYTAIRQKRKIHDSMTSTDWQLELVTRQGKKLLSIANSRGGNFSKAESVPFIIVWLYTDYLTQLEIPEIHKLSDKFYFNKKSISRWLLYNRVKGYPYQQYIHANPEKPITERGYYIPVKHDTSLNEVIESYKIAHRFAIVNYCIDNKIDPDNYKHPRRTYVKEDVIEKDNLKITSVKLIEREIKKIYEESDIATNNPLKSNGVVMQAIERVAGDLLQDVEDDQEFETNLETFITGLKTNYYSTLRKYKIPKFTDFQNILDFLGL